MSLCVTVIMLVDKECVSMWCFSVGGQRVCLSVIILSMLVDNVSQWDRCFSVCGQSVSECDYSFHVGGQCVSVGLVFQCLWTKSVSECDYSFHVGGQCVLV